MTLSERGHEAASPGLRGQQEKSPRSVMGAGASLRLATMRLSSPSQRKTPRG